MNRNNPFPPPGTYERPDPPSGDWLNPEWRVQMIRARLKEILTDIQFRRVVLHYGLMGYEPQSYRDIAEIQNRSLGSIEESLRQARVKMKQDPVLFLLWFFNGVQG